MNTRRRKVSVTLIILFIIIAGLLAINLNEVESSLEGTESTYGTEEFSSDLDESTEEDNGQADEELETENQESQVAAICESVRAMDFTVNEAYMDVTPEENREYLKAYLKVLKNDMPIYDQIGKKMHYRDLWRAGFEFEDLLENKGEREFPYLYYYDDLDGDGKPEFAINQGCLYIFNYELGDDFCKIICYQQSCYFEKIIGAGQIWYHDGLHACSVRDRLIIFDEENEEVLINFEKGIADEWPYYAENDYYMVGIGEEEWFDVGKDNWDEITAPFFEMVEHNGLQEMTLEEVFGELLTSEGKKKWIKTVEEDMQGNIIGYTLEVSQTGNLTYRPDPDYLISGDKVGKGVYESEHMSVVTAYLGQMLAELLECRGSVSEEKRQYFSEYALLQMAETDWTLLDDNWNADPFAYHRDYQMNSLIQGYDFTYDFYPEAECKGKERTQYVRIRLSVDGTGIIRGIKIEIEEASSERASMTQFVSLTDLYDDEYKEWIVCDGASCQDDIMMDFSMYYYYHRWQEEYNRETISEAISCAEKTAEMLFDVIESRGAHAVRYRKAFGYDTFFQKFKSLSWNKLGDNWIVNERYDCEYIDRTEIGYVGLRFYFYPDYEEMGAESAEVIVFECNMDERSDIDDMDLYRFELTKEEYEIARQTRSDRGTVLIEDGKRVEEGLQIYIPVPDTEEPYGILLKEFDFANTEEKAGVSVVGQELWGYTNLSETAAFLGEKIQGDFENEELRERDLETGETVKLFEDEDTFPDYEIELFFERAGEGFKASEAYDCYYIKENERADCIHLRYYFYPQVIEGEEETVLVTDVYASVQGIVDMQLHSYTRKQYLSVNTEDLDNSQTISEEDSSEIYEIEMEQASLKKVEDGCELALYDKSNKKVYSEIYPMPEGAINLPVIKEISEGILEISFSVGSPAVYIFFFNKETAEISPTYFNPFIVENQYVAYMDDKNDILLFTDMFQKKGIIEIERNFAPYANPIEAVIDIKMIDSYYIELQYYEGENFMEKSEVILLDFK